MSTPNADDLVALVANAAEEARAHFNAHPDPVDKIYILYRLLAEEGTRAGLLKAALRSDPELEGLVDGWISIPGMGWALQDHVLPSFLIRHVLEGGDAGEVIASLKAFAQRVDCGLEFSAAVVGITVDAALRLSDTISVVPWMDVPEVERKKFELDPAAIAGDRVSPHFAQPTAAINVVLPSRRVLFSSHGDAELSGVFQAGATEAERAMQTAHDVVRCATLATTEPVAIVSTWTRLVDAWANSLWGRGYSYTDALFDFSLLGAASAPVNLTGSELPALFSALQRHPEEGQSVLRLTADRLGAALRRPSLVDKAIDLGIALEALILHDLKDKGELSYRIAVRGSAYAGTTVEERRRIFKLLRKVYELRSTAVHTGNLRLKASAAATVIEDLKSGLRVATAITSKIVLAGRFPGWEDYVLGEAAIRERDDGADVDPLRT